MGHEPLNISALWPGVRPKFRIALLAHQRVQLIVAPMSSPIATGKKSFHNQI